MKSHFRLGSQAGQAVMSSGHEVWIMGPAKNREDAVKKGFHYLEYDSSNLETAEEEAAEQFTTAMLDPDSNPSVLSILCFIKAANFHVCNQTLSNKALMNTIRDQNFDLALMGTTLMMTCMYLIPYKFDIPYVTYEPIDEPWIAGVAALPSNQPSSMADPHSPTRWHSSNGYETHWYIFYSLLRQISWLLVIMPLGLLRRTD